MKAMLIAHVEKLVLVLVLIGCAWAIYSTLTDPATRSEATLPKVIEVGRTVEEAYNQAGYPNFKRTRNFAADIEQRLALDLDSEELGAWLTGHPTPLGAPVEAASTDVYAYEIVEPTVVAEDEIGSIVIRVEVPQGDRPDRERDVIKDAPAAVWYRQEPGRGDVHNVAEQVAVYLEYSVGEGKFQPLETADSPGGFAPLQGGRSASLVLANVEEWAQYQIRARTVVLATGALPGQQRSVGREVLVLHGPLSAEPGDKQRVAELADRLPNITPEDELPGRVARTVEVPNRLRAMVRAVQVPEEVPPDALTAFIGEPLAHLHGLDPGPRGRPGQQPEPRGHAGAQKARARPERRRAGVDAGSGVLGRAG